MVSIQANIRKQVFKACRRLLSEINRDAATPTCGCFDRRYWAWKTIDFPEATFQRNLSALAWMMEQPENDQQRAFYIDVIHKGLLYTTKIQHKSGSFDQAYPYEESYGATAFLLPDLIDAYLSVKNGCSIEEQTRIEAMISKATSFLYKRAELHGTISNHLAGAALALLKASRFLEKDTYAHKSQEIVHGIIGKQSPEGWYVEYGGADPGYQTLCIYYLAQVYQIAPEDNLRASLEASLYFLQYFIHPDGTFGGEYGSRRTEVYYPGGIALLSGEFPLAAAMSERMLAAIAKGQTVTLDNIDMGNTAPLLNNTIKSLGFKISKKSILLPYTQKDLFKEFPQAGLMARSTEKYYCITGISNGGVVKLFNKESSQIALDDCGLLGETTSRGLISTQFSNADNEWQGNQDKIELTSAFYKIQATLPGPFNFLLLRLMNLTIMRVGFLNELVKKLLVRLLISGSQRVPLNRSRVITFKSASVEIKDKVTQTGALKLKWLRYGGKFSSIHMASARYFTPAQLSKQMNQTLDTAQLDRKDMIKNNLTINF